VFGLLGLADNTPDASEHLVHPLAADYTLSPWKLFCEVLSAHKPQSVNNLAQELYLALELKRISSTPSSTWQVIRVPCKLIGGETLVRKEAELCWDRQSEQHLFILPAQNQQISEGAILYTLFSKDVNASRCLKLFIILRKPPLLGLPVDPSTEKVEDRAAPKASKPR
jgi:hypothetical protein